MTPDIGERVAAIETRCVERGKGIDRLESSVEQLDDSVEGLKETITRLNGTLKLVAYKIHVIWLFATLVLNTTTVIFLTKYLAKGG